jgi:N-ethylmaleimide reductase
MNSALFQPFRLHDLTLPNRVILSPMTRAGAARLPNRLMAEYYHAGADVDLVVGFGPWRVDARVHELA